MCTCVKCKGWLRVVLCTCMRGLKILFSVVFFYFFPYQKYYHIEFLCSPSIPVDSFNLISVVCV